MTQSTPIKAQSTAALIIIGNEILSGRTHDKNIPFLGHSLNECGVRLMEVRVVPDIAQTIIDTVNEMRHAWDYVFTTGGIGPTHDDITAQSVADAFGVPLIKHPEAFALLEEYYKDREQEFNVARQKMGYVPEGARLIANPVTTAPGFCFDNVYTMAGVPKIMRSMFENIRHELKGGSPLQSRCLDVKARESVLAELLAEVEQAHEGMEIGSYPYMKEGELWTNIVVRHLDETKIDAAIQSLEAWLSEQSISFVPEGIAI